MEILTRLNTAQSLFSAYARTMLNLHNHPCNGGYTRLPARQSIDLINHYQELGKQADDLRDCLVSLLVSA